MWGLASFSTVRLFKSTRFRAELNTTSNPAPINSVEDHGGRVWRWQFFVGVQNNFKISNSIAANVQLLYNFDKKLKDAFPERLSVRIGIQYKFQKKSR